jgi:hypothetical protein
VHCISPVIATKEAIRVVACSRIASFLAKEAIRVVACARIASFLAMTGRETATGSFAAGRRPAVMEITSFGLGLSGMESVQCVTSVINNVFILSENNFYSVLDDIFCNGMEIFCNGIENVTSRIDFIPSRIEFIPSQIDINPSKKQFIPS